MCVSISPDKLPVYEPNIPEPTSRAELLKCEIHFENQIDTLEVHFYKTDMFISLDWIVLSLDERTANNVLWLSEGGSKVSRLMTEVCPCLNRPERFDHYPQVMCKESIWASRCYWEVSCSGWVVIGVAYEGAGRKIGDGQCGLGENEESWALGWDGSCYDAWHNGVSMRVLDMPHCSTIGVYVDQPAGLISFFTVETEESSKKKDVKLIHRFKNPIKEGIVPGFWMGSTSSCLILKKEE